MTLGALGVLPGPPNIVDSKSPKGLADWFRGGGMAKSSVAIPFNAFKVRVRLRVFLSKRDILPL